MAVCYNVQHGIECVLVQNHPVLYLCLGNVHVSLSKTNQTLYALRWLHSICSILSLLDSFMLSCFRRLVISVDHAQMISCGRTAVFKLYPLSFSTYSTMLSFQAKC